MIIWMLVQLYGRRGYLLNGLEYLVSIDRFGSDQIEMVGKFQIDVGLAGFRKLIASWFFFDKFF